MNVRVVRPIILFGLAFFIIFGLKKCRDTSPKTLSPKLVIPKPSENPYIKPIKKIEDKVDKVENKVEDLILQKLGSIEQRLNTMEFRLNNFETYLPETKLVNVNIEDLLDSNSGQNMNWRKSSVDLMKILELDHSEENRKKMAKDYGWDGLGGEKVMNDFLRKQIMNKLSTGEIKFPVGK